MISKVLICGNQRSVLLAGFSQDLGPRKCLMRDWCSLEKSLDTMGWRGECLRALVAKETLGEAALKCILKSGREEEKRGRRGVGWVLGHRKALPPATGTVSCLVPHYEGACREQVQGVLGTCFPTAVQPEAECREQVAKWPLPLGPPSLSWRP